MPAGNDPPATINAEVVAASTKITLLGGTDWAVPGNLPGSPANSKREEEQGFEHHAGIPSSPSQRFSVILKCHHARPVGMRGFGWREFGSMNRFLCAVLLALGAMAFGSGAAFADGGICPRLPPQSPVNNPPDIYSQNGIIDIAMNYYTSVDDAGRTLFCFVTSDGMESPTLHVNPGDKIKIRLTNQVPNPPGGRSEVMFDDTTKCGNKTMTDASINMHFHGTNTSPRCHSDEVIHTLVNSGETFQYVLHIPKDEPPGLYWYHPHVHGTSSHMLQGGATGMIEVQGIANIQPAVAGLPERFIILRDQQFEESDVQGPGFPATPFWDTTINYVPVT